MKQSLTAICLLSFFWFSYPGNVLGQQSSLTLDQLKNATYLMGNQKIKLTNGHYEEGTTKDGTYYEVNFYKAALGDLNKDGNNDAAVVYYTNAGGSGSDAVLAAMINQNGRPVQVADVDLGQKDVQSISIKGSKIILNMLVHGPNDPMVRPTVKQTRKYMLAANKLVLSP